MVYGTALAVTLFICQRHEKLLCPDYEFSFLNSQSSWNSFSVVVPQIWLQITQIVENFCLVLLKVILG